MTKDVERTITVAKPIADVWAYLSDFTTTNEWDPGTVKTTRESGGGGMGTVYKNISKFAGKETELTYTVEGFAPEHQITLRGENDSVTTHDTMTFSGDETQTVIVYQATFDLKGAAKLAEPLLPLGLKVLGDETKDSMQEHLEKL